MNADLTRGIFMHRYNRVMRAGTTLTRLALIFCALNLPLFGQDSPGAPARMTVWSGVYSQAQATQGQAVYTARCGRCHGDDLNGAAVGTSLIGDRFLQFWREDTVESLFIKIRDTMPRNSLGTMKDEEYLNVTAYILQRNGFPTGSMEMTPETMRASRIEGKDGPQPLPTNSMIQVVGCMTRDGDTWTLTKATSPVRTRTADKISPDELKTAQNTPLGTATFRLQNFSLLGSFNPEAHQGHTMLAKGPLLRRSNTEIISITALETVGGSCGP
jgi:mono/diheme cytochrome c family protein